MIEWYILGIPWEYHDICGSAMVFLVKLHGTCGFHQNLRKTLW